ncbi:MAG: GAF domain-containing protein [Chloroflexota bacterium]
MERNILKYPSLRLRLSLAFALAGTLLSAIIITTLYANFRQGLREELRQRLASITTVGALQQDGDMLLKVQEANDEYFQIINEQNIKIKKSDADIVYVYTMVRKGQDIVFIVDAGTPADEGLAEFGSVYLEPGPTLVENFDTLESTIVEPDFYTDEYGTFLSAYAPIRNSNGKTVGVFAIDISAETVIAKEQKFFNFSILIFILTLVVVIVLGIVLGNVLASPITALANVTQSISQGNLSERFPDTVRVREVAQLGHNFNEMTANLDEVINSLEDRVESRTRELEATSAQMTRRAAQLQTIARVAQSIAVVQDFDRLLPDIAKTISEQFGFYHVGIFLLDENKEFAVLRAANSEGGQKMLARNHKLRVGQEGIVGHTVAEKKARVALDVGGEAVFFDNPDLPATRSEIALPLIIGTEVIGALDVQSEEPGAFSSEDIEVLTTLTNQVSVAIENSRLFETSQKTVKELEKTIQLYIQSEWRHFSNRSPLVGYRATQAGLEQLQNPLQENGSSGKKDAVYKVPIKLRGATIATLDVDLGKDIEKYTPEELAIIQAASERVALALENARLLQDSQRRAAKEQLIGDISARISASINMRNVLQAAVEELGRVMPGSEIVVQFQGANPAQDRG